MPFIRFADGSPEMRYLHARREALGGYLPSRRRKSEPLHGARRSPPSRRS